MKRKKRRNKKRGNKGFAAMLLLCAAVIAALSVRLYAPELPGQAVTAFKSLFGEGGSVSAAFTYFGEALAGEESFSDVFAYIFGGGEQS